MHVFKKPNDLKRCRRGGLLGWFVLRCATTFLRDPSPCVIARKSGSNKQEECAARQD